jgi:hypothetical protein
MGKDGLCRASIHLRSKRSPLGLDISNDVGGVK